MKLLRKNNIVYVVAKVSDYEVIIALIMQDKLDNRGGNSIVHITGGVNLFVLSLFDINDLLSLS